LIVVNAQRIDNQIHLSPVDEERFGIRTARTFVDSQDGVQSVLASSRQQDIKLLIARCPTPELHVVQAMESAGFQLMDTLVYYRRDLKKTPPADKPELPYIRPYRDGDVDGIKAVAEQSFKGYYGHYHADPRLDPVKADEGYVSWAVRSCLSREVAEEVLVAEFDGSIQAFITLRMNSLDEGEAVVGGVMPSAQGGGTYRAFIIHTMHWCLEQGATFTVLSTQITNIAVQKVWARLGFEMNHSYYTFHKWFD
jgi:hypothetical protein